MFNDAINELAVKDKMTENTRLNISMTGLLLIVFGVGLRFFAPIWTVYLPVIPGMLLLTIARKWHLGWVFATIGGCCNFLAIATNHGKMPVFGHIAITDSSHTLVTSAHLAFLCDYIQVGIGIASPGDLIWFVGLLLAIMIPARKI